MGMTIDEENKFMEESKKHFKEWHDMNYIPKADYENRLKADMVDMLTEIQVGIGEHINPSNHTDSYEDGWSEGAEWCIDYIQQKINSLKEAK